MSYQLDDLLRLMMQLRDPAHGCPWDRQQNLASIVPHTLDEVYEVIDTIEREDYPHLQDELGDLLFQVVFYAQICAEQGRFQFADIIDGLVAKLLRRHPHVYPDGSFASFGSSVDLSEAEIKQSWERIKAEERALKEAGKESVQEAVQETEQEAEKTSPQSPLPGSILDDLSTAMPALMRAHKLQKRAASVGFDWRQIEPVLDNLDAEMLELRQALAGGDKSEIADELGDLLFSCVNLVRHLKQDSEQLLRQSNQKFEQRFRRVEQLAAKQGLVLADSDEASLDRLWQQAKHELREPKKLRQSTELSQPLELIDTLGLVCPLPLIRLLQRLESLPPGSEVCLLADDPSTLNDIPDWCLQTGHQLLSIDTSDAQAFKIRVLKPGRTPA
tara:strand:- start:1130 stop:2290 length:1161 start_codon:yes stop_codon:yes gene_type:complete